jgi:hypothetical protein
MPIIQAQIRIAFLWQPLFLLDGQQIYMAEFSVTEPLAGVPVHWTENGQPSYRAISRRPVPLLSKDGQPVTLSSEIGPDSLVRLSLARSGNALVIKAVSVIEHRSFNPFRVLETSL